MLLLLLQFLFLNELKFVKFVDSTLQTFPPSGAQGKISGASRPPRDADGIYHLILFEISLHIWSPICMYKEID